MNKFTYTHIRNFYKPDLIKNDPAHNLVHCDDVFKRMLNMNDKLELGVSEYLICLASYIHDIKAHVDRKNHHVLAYEYIKNNYKVDLFLKKLTKVEVHDLAMACLLHRASEKSIRFSKLSNLLASGDKDEPDLYKIVTRSLKYNKNIFEVYDHIIEKFSRNGYMNYNKFYVIYYGQEAIDSLYDDIANLSIEYISDVKKSIG